MSACPLCVDDGGVLIRREADWRIVRAIGPDADALPGWYRVVWNAHVREWTDLAPADQWRCLEVLNHVERCVRQHLSPTKVNLAAFGNAVPHLHWHIVARFEWDSRFPGSPWSAPVRADDAHRLADMRSRLAACDDAIARGVF